MMHDRELGSHGQPQAYVGRDDKLPGVRVRNVWQDDVMWTVYERLHGVQEERSPRLIFENGMAVRTLRRYPADWAMLPDDELMELSEQW